MSRQIIIEGFDFRSSLDLGPVENGEGSKQDLKTDYLYRQTFARRKHICLTQMNMDSNLLDEVPKKLEGKERH